jgi:multidrug efflux pump
VDVNLKFNKPELIIEINRDKAKTMGVSIADVAQTIQLALSGQRFGYYIKGDKQYQVVGQVNRENVMIQMILKICLSKTVKVK